jgi:hypothetical protein
MKDAAKFLDKIAFNGSSPNAGDYVRAQRKILNFTLDDLENVTGIDKANLSLYENDKNSLGLIQATKIGLAIGLHPMSILFPNGYEKSSQFKDIESNMMIPHGEEYANELQ